MGESDNKLNDIASRKAKIRERYQGVDITRIEKIPAAPKVDFFHDDQERRVAVYVRVSTDDVNQTTSYELQKKHYMDFVGKHPNWHLVDIYADEGISGTSVKHRVAFNRMIADCHAGKIDLIVTKSVSRFARNLVDCVAHARKLKELTPPVGIYFETDQMCTLNESEMRLSFLSLFAQEESHMKSSSMNASVEMRFSRGIFLTPPLLGYDKDDGNLVINEDEAKTVRLIFFTYLYGYSCKDIAELLTFLKRPTKKGNTRWSSGSVLGILQNERHCGSVLSRKTFTPNYLDHKVKKNRGERNQYRQAEHHEPIISPDDFIAVQRLISNAKYGNKGFFPELHVITQGALRGFVRIHPRWSSFRAQDYEEASKSVYESEEDDSAAAAFTAKEGDPDFRGFEIARSQFFETPSRISVTFTLKQLKFSAACISKLTQTEYVELLIHPVLKLLAVRPCGKDSRHKVQWSKMHDGNKVPKIISGTAFLGTVYEMLQWNRDFKYRIRGIRRQKGDKGILIFNLSEPEVFMPAQSFFSESGADPVVSASSNMVLAYPSAWADTFGTEYYSHEHDAVRTALDDEPEGMNETGIPYQAANALQVTGHEEVVRNIDEILMEFSQEESKRGEH